MGRARESHIINVFGLFISAILGIASSSQAANTGAAPVDSPSEWDFGIEGFADHYEEPSLGVDNHASYGSVTANYKYTAPDNIFGAIDGRISIGSESYRSPSGTESGVTQDEFELRLRSGINLPLLGGTLSPYAGLGARYYIDEAKDTFTSLGDVGYDRHILQFYAPIGSTYKYVGANEWTFSPTFEFDPLLVGYVNSRLQNAGGPNLNNTQHNGYGLRGEFMVGNVFPNNIAWQAGPFVRYWKIQQSNTDHVTGGYGYEPENDRTQIGLAVRFLY